MVEEKICPLFRKTETLGMGKGLGYCDIDSSSAICEGDVLFCERPDALKKYLLEKLGDLEREEK